MDAAGVPAGLAWKAQSAKPAALSLKKKKKERRGERHFFRFFETFAKRDQLEFVALSNTVRVG